MLGQNFGGPQGQNGSESAPSAGSNDKLKLSDASIAAAKAFARGGGFGGGRGRGFGGPDQGTTVDPQLSKLMKDPSANEPLQFHVQEAIQTVAQDKNCVALLPDSLLTSLGRVLSSGISLDSLTKTLSSDEGYEASSADGWFTFAPKFRIDSRNSRVDRAALKTLLQAISQKGSARLDDIAVYATRSPYQSGGLDLNIVRMVDPASAGDVGQVYGDDRDMLLMWAGMSPNTRSTLANGRKLQINSVSMSAHKLLGGLVFNSNDGPNVTAQAQTQTQSGAVAQVTIETFRVQQGRGPGGRGGRGGFNSNLATERTELLPNGVSTMSLLSMQVEEEPVTKATQSTAGLARTMTARDMAREKAFSEMPQDPNGGGRPQRPVINWDGYVAGTQISRTFVFELANNVTITRTLQDTSFSPGSKSGSFDALPDSFRAAYQESYENMKNRGNDRGDGRAAGRRGRNGNGQRPPGP
ncbi:MAG: hypothetical protein JNM34_10410 [Chthonomonadaceae bacterium]|nr:hypothetical protein [Chthonomonadaceae bacterium]